MRLSIVLDTRNSPERIGEIAKMCDRAGIDALWLHDDLHANDAGSGTDTWAGAEVAALETDRARIGVMCLPALRPPALLAQRARALNEASSGRLELGFIAAGGLDGYASSVLLELAGVSSDRESPPISIGATSAVEIDVASRLGDDVVILPESAREIGELVDRIASACVASGRDAVTLGIALEVPVSIGRTPAEAHARVQADPSFSAAGHPALSGIFGTLEECQDRVIELAHAGVTDLRCVVPNTPDVADVIAQITAMTIGSVDLLTPGAPRSPSPAPPEGWGGRVAPG